MPDCSYGELVDRVMALAKLAPTQAAGVAEFLWDLFPGESEHITPRAILEAAEKMGHEVEWPEAIEDAPEAEPESLPEVSVDPATVLMEVYRACQRCLPKQEGQDKVFMPRVGRAPKESLFYDEALREQIEALPEEIKVLIGGVDLFQNSVTFTLYDEANDVDRKVGPIDLTRYETGEELHSAINVLLSRLERVLASDWN